MPTPIMEQPLALHPRILVTGHDGEGNAVLASEQQPEPVVLDALPGAEFYQAWGTPDGIPVVGEHDPKPVLQPYFPGPGGSRVIYVRWAPHSAEPVAEVDPVQARRQADERLPGLMDVFEHEGEGIHTTDTVDYGICLEGELWLRLDNEAEAVLRPGTCVVQLGTRHAWENRSDRPALMCYVQIGARRASAGAP
jgi:quercetin dioxygenase-like cupin family protein